MILYFPYEIEPEIDSLRSLFKLMLNLNKSSLLPIIIASVRNGYERFSYFKYLYSE